MTGIIYIGCAQRRTTSTRRDESNVQTERYQSKRHEIVMDTVGSDESFARARPPPGPAAHACAGAAGGQRVTGRAVSATNRTRTHPRPGPHAQRPQFTHLPHTGGGARSAGVEPQLPDTNRDGERRSGSQLTRRRRTRRCQRSWSYSWSSSSSSFFSRPRGLRAVWPRRSQLRA